MTDPAASNPEVGTTIQAAGVRTNVHVHGDGEAVLLLHGSGPGVSAWANWRLTIPALSPRFRVIAPDVLGFGYTEHPKDVRYSKQGWLEHILGVMDALGITRAHVVGNSFGGAMALALATEHPDRVGKIVLMGSVGIEFDLTPGLDAVWGYEPTLDYMRKLLDIFAYNRSLVTDELAQLRHRAATRPGVAEAFISMFPAPRQRWIAALATDEAALRHIPHKTLIVHGREDRVIPVSNAYRLFDLLSNAQLHAFGHCGHWVQIEHKDAFNRIVADFLA
jgi:2-hydroxymuconate-semialdehyde hydrolase